MFLSSISFVYNAPAWGRSLLNTESSILGVYGLPRNSFMLATHAARSINWVRFNYGLLYRRIVANNKTCKTD